MAFGLSYYFTEAFRLYAGYAHLFVKDASSNLVSSTGDRMVGDWDLSVDVISTNVVWSF